MRRCRRIWHRFGLSEEPRKVGEAHGCGYVDDPEVPDREYWHVSTTLVINTSSRCFPRPGVTISRAVP
jgi:hypothetical protein